MRTRESPGFVAESDGRIVGSDFLDERSGSSSVGPLTVAPGGQDRGVRRRADGRITAYTTGIGFGGHSVAMSNGDLCALVADADEFTWTGFLVPLRNDELMRWCVGHGLRIVYTLNLMATGFYQQPRAPFLPSIGF